MPLPGITGSTVRGSSVQVLEPSRAQLTAPAPSAVTERRGWNLNLWVQGQEQEDECRIFEGDEQMLGSARNGRTPLSQRKEFRGRNNCKVSSAPLPPRGGLWITVTCGQRGRRTVEAGRSADQLQILPTAGLRLPRPDTNDMAGLAEELAALRDPVGGMSDRFPGPPAWTRQTSLAMPSARVAELDVEQSRHRRGGSRHKKAGYSPGGNEANTATEQQAGSESPGVRIEQLVGYQDALTEQTAETADVPGQQSVGAQKTMRELLAESRGTMVEQLVGSEGAATVLGPVMSFHNGHGFGATEVRERTVPLLEQAGDQRSPALSTIEATERMSSARKPADSDGSGGVQKVLSALGVEEKAFETASGRGLLTTEDHEERRKGRSEGMPVPESVEAQLVWGETRLTVVVAREDWMEMQDLGMMLHPGLAVGFAWRRSLPGLRRPLPAIRLLSSEELEIPMHAWPSSWEGLVAHVEEGGTFRVDGRLRGGMDPRLQAVLDQTVFDESIPWDTLDDYFTRISNGSALPDGAPDNLRLLSEALGTVCALNQWRHVRQLSQETLASSTATALRLTVLGVVLSRNKVHNAVTYDIPAELRGNRFVGLQFHHVNPTLLVHGSLDGDTKIRLEEGAVNSLLEAVPQLAQCPLMNLPQTRQSVKLKCNLRSPGLMSLTMVIPHGPWVKDILNRTGILKGDSFATLAQGGSIVELELPMQTKQILVAIQRDLNLDNRFFLQLLDESLGRAFGEPIKCWNTTVRSTGTGQQRTTIHFDPDADESCIQFVVDIPSLLLARRHNSHLEILLGRDNEFPVGIRFAVQPCPRAVLQTMARRLDHTSVRRRERGQSFGGQIVLIGPLPKNWVAKELGRDDAARVNLCRTFADHMKNLVLAQEVMFFGRWERSADPMGVYIEFSTPQAADDFGTLSDSGQLPREINMFCTSWFFAGTDYYPDLWASDTLAEVLDTLKESDLKKLMPRRNEQPGPVVIGNPAVQEASRQVADGTAAAAGAPDNPSAAGH